MGVPLYAISQSAGAYKIPKAGADGKIAVGFIPDLSATYQPLDADLTALAALAATGFARRTGANTWSVAALSSVDLPSHSHAAGDISSGMLALAQGGSGADLSATGGANQFLKQSGVGAALSVGAILSADLTSALTAPPPIGGTTPAAGTFTALNASGISILGVAGVNDGRLNINPASSQVGLKIRNPASSPANVFSFEDSAGTAMLYMNHGGQMFWPGGSFGNGIYFGTNTNSPTRITGGVSQFTSGVGAGNSFFQLYHNDNAVAFRARSNSHIHMQVVDGRYVGIGVPVANSPLARLHVIEQNAVTNGVSDATVISHQSTGTPAAGFGVRLILALESSTTEDQSAGAIEAVWSDATHASRKADLILSAYDTAKREGLRIRGNGSAAALGLFGATPVAQSTGWSVTNPSTRKTFDTTTVTLPQLAEVVGTLIDYLKTLGPLAA